MGLRHFLSTNLAGLVCLLVLSSSAVAGIIRDDFLVSYKECSWYSLGIPALSMDQTGNFCICWWGWYEDSLGQGKPHIYARRFDSSGQPLGEMFYADDDSAVPYRGSYFPLALAMAPDGDFVIGWVDKRFGDDLRNDIYVQLFTSSGERVGSNRRVTDATDAARDPLSVAMDSDGSFLICWDNKRHQDHDIYAQRFNSLGQKIGPNFRVNDSTVYDQEAPVIAVGGQGNYLIAWYEFYLNNPHRGLYGQRYNSSGERIGSNLRLGDVGMKEDPAIAMHPDGSFILAWSTILEGKSFWTVVAQRFNSLAAPVDSAFNVVDDRYVYADRPGLAMNNAGDWVVCWPDRRYDYHDIFAQRYYSDDFPCGSNYRVNREMNSQTYCPSAAFVNDRIVFTWPDFCVGEECDDGIFAKVVTWDWNKVDDPKHSCISHPNPVLSPNYPNPLNSDTQIAFDLPGDVYITLMVYNVSGQRVAELVNGILPAGHHTVSWNALGVPSGIYFCRITAGGFTATRKIVLLK